MNADDGGRAGRLMLAEAARVARRPLSFSRAPHVPAPSHASGSYRTNLVLSLRAPRPPSPQLRPGGKLVVVSYGEPADRLPLFGLVRPADTARTRTGERPPGARGGGGGLSRARFG